VARFAFTAAPWLDSFPQLLAPPDSTASVPKVHSAIHDSGAKTGANPAISGLGGRITGSSQRSAAKERTASTALTCHGKTIKSLASP